MTHNIRLHGPWQCVFPQNSDKPPHSVKLPADLRNTIPQPPPAGSVQLQRKFNLPTGLSPAQQVTLVFEQAEGVAAVLLNNKPLDLQLADAGLLRAEITHLLQQQNQLVVELLRDGGAALPAGLTGEIRIEIAGE